MKEAERLNLNVVSMRYFYALLFPCSSLYALGDTVISRLIENSFI